MYQTKEQTAKRIHGIQKRKTTILKGIDINRRVKITNTYYQNSSPELKKRYPDFISFKKAFYKALKTQKREIRILNETLPPTKEELCDKDNSGHVFKNNYKLTKLSESKKISKQSKKSQNIPYIPEQVSYPKYIPTPIEKSPKSVPTLFDHLNRSSKTPSPCNLDEIFRNLTPSPNPDSKSESILPKSDSKTELILPKPDLTTPKQIPLKGLDLPIITSDIIITQPIQKKYYQETNPKNPERPPTPGKFIHIPKKRKTALTISLPRKYYNQHYNAQNPIEKDDEIVVPSSKELENYF